MKKINANTKKAMGIINSYDNAYVRDLGGCYDTWSSAKQHAFNYCLELMSKLGGFDGRIMSWNTFSFTYGFQFVDKETGELKLAYITKDYDYVIE